MIGLVLVTHGRLAEELRLAMEHVVGTQKNVATVCIGADDDIESRRAEIQCTIDRVDTGDGVVLLTDMFGGTPSNLAISMMSRDGVEVIAGVNLPMLVRRLRAGGGAEVYRRRLSCAARVQGERHLRVGACTRIGYAMRLGVVAGAGGP
jgi:PTS system mannose-specific IIA component